MSLTDFLILMASGAVGGNAVAVALSNTPGLLINTLAGLAGGAIGGQILTSTLGAATGDIGGLVQLIASGGSGGVILAVLTALAKTTLRR